MRTKGAAVVKSTQTPLPELPTAILGRLKAERILTCEDWQALGLERGRIFGITRRMRKVIDAAVADALERGRI